MVTLPTAPLCKRGRITASVKSGQTHTDVQLSKSLYIRLSPGTYSFTLTSSNTPPVQSDSQASAADKTSPGCTINVTVYNAGESLVLDHYESCYSHSLGAKSVQSFSYFPIM